MTMALRRPSRRRANAKGGGRGEETSLRIVEAALEIFGSSGYDSASTRAIAKRAGVNLPALQYYFGGKAGLYLACAHHIAAAFEERLSAIERRNAAALAGAALSQPELRGLLRGVVEAFVVRLVDVPEPGNWVLFMVRELTRPTAAFDVFYERVLNRLVQLCATLVGLILGEPAEAPQTLIRALSIVGQLLFFVRAREAVLRLLGWHDFEGDRLDQIKRILWSQTEAALTRASQEPFHSIDGRGRGVQGAE